MVEPRLKKEGTANSGSLDPKQEIMMYRRSWDARDMTTPEPPYKATAVQRRKSTKRNIRLFVEPENSVE